MYHYAYLLTFENGMQYVGARSTHLEPHLDTTYLGSGRKLPKDRHDNRHTVTKVILACFNTREDLMEYEKNFIVQNGCCESNAWYNQRRKTHDRHGSIPHNKGKSGLPSTSGKTLSQRYGNGYRTPAQIAGAAAMRKKLTGVPNPLKGHSGITNTAFKAWYYITPTGEYVEVHDKTKRDLAPQLGFTERQLINAFHWTNEHKQARTLPRKGWTFGNLPRPTDTATD